MHLVYSELHGRVKLTYISIVTNRLHDAYNAYNLSYSLPPSHEFVCILFRTGNLNCFKVSDHDEQHGMCAKG